MRFATIILGTVILSLLEGCSSGAFKIPEVLRSEKGSPNLNEGNAEGTDGGQSLDEPVPVAGAFLVCREDQSLKPGEAAFELGCRLEDAAGERVVAAADAVPTFSLLAEDGSSLGFDLERGAADSYWEWHLSTDPAFGFPALVKVTLTKGDKSESFEAKTTRQPEKIGIMSFFQLGDNILTDGISPIPGVTCATVKAQVTEERHGTSVTAMFTVTAPSARVSVVLKGACGGEPSSDLRIFDMTANKEVAAAKPVDGDSAHAFQLPKGQYQMRLTTVFKTPTDRDDFAVESLSIQGLKAGDIEGVTPALVK